MINKYLTSRTLNVKYVVDNLDEFLSNCLDLSRYSEDDPYRAIAERNYLEAFDFILEHPEVEADYESLCDLHAILMKDLDAKVNAQLTVEQILELQEMINTDAAVLVGGYYNFNICGNKNVSGVHNPTCDFYWITNEIKPEV